MEPLLAHTATKLGVAAGRVVVCGSHGGAYVGHLAAAAAVRAILLNDAGIGREEAGIAGLAVLDAHAIAAAALDHRSCRIGNASSAWATGVVSIANRSAAALGVAPGASAAEAAHLLAAAPAGTAEPQRHEEHRRVAAMGALRLVILDSIALVRSGEDDGAVVVAGSHGGLVGDDPASAGRAEAALFAFNDAGVGLDGAGISRLPALAARRIPAVTVAHTSARIGDGMSTLEDGVVSHANGPAAALGARPGEPLRALVERLAARAPAA